MCNDGSQGIEATAEPGFTNYQWYIDINDGNGYLPIDATNGGTNQVLTLNTAGHYLFTIDDGVLESCGNQLCCPIVVQLVPCINCPPPVCVPIAITKIN